MTVEALTLAWPPTEDQIILIVATIAAIVGAVYAVRNDRFTRADREADIQPRLQAEWGGGEPGRGSVSFSNAGGSATRFVWVGQNDAGVYTAQRGSIPQHTPSVVFTPLSLGSAKYRGGIGTTLLIAEDVRGRWWDCIAGTLLTQPANDYIAKRMNQAGLPEFADIVTGIAVPPHLPRD